MGLLDLMNSEQGMLGLSLLAAAAPQAGPRNTGAGLLGALQNVQGMRDANARRAAEAEDRAMRRQAQELQQQQAQMALQQMQHQQAQQQTDASALRNLFSPLPGPTQDGSQLRRGFDPAGMLQSGASPQALQQAAQLNSLVNPRPERPKFMEVGGNLVRVGADDSVSEAYRAPQKPDAGPADWQLYQLSGAASKGIPFDQWDHGRRRASASTTSVNYGTPVPAIGQDGSPVYLQPSKDGGPAHIIPGVRPPKSAGEERADQERAQRSRQGEQMVSALNDAEAILKGGRATASGVGNVVDAGARVVGVTTPGAQDAARLEALSGWLVSNVPRMEGPQSNFDVQNYMTMAGKVGDRTTPIQERMAALTEVRRLQGKYASINGTPMQSQPQQQGAPRVGEVRKGYRFKGGDPSQQSNWERQ